MKNQAAWDAIKAKAEEIGWPTIYKKDLETDRDDLAGKFGHDITTFAWLLQEAGTNIFLAIQDVVKADMIYKGVQHYWFYWDDNQLIECKNAADVINRMVKQ